MTHDELKFLIAEAARITGEKYIYVVGSNALLGTVTDPQNTVFTRSRELDIIPGSNDPKKADQIDFVLGELSEFDNRHHFYAQGLTLETPKYAPDGWQARTVRLPVSRDVAGLCMEVHDLALSKYGAGREKDIEFTHALAKAGYVNKQTLMERLPLVPAEEKLRRLIAGRIERDFSETG
jgi:hypothetical protein